MFQLSSQSSSQRSSTITTVAIAVLSGGLAAFELAKRYRRYRLGAPGPLPLPIVGNMPTVMANMKFMHVWLGDLKKRYGRVFLLEGVWQHMVFVTDAALMQEVLGDSVAFRDRFIDGVFDVFLNQGLASLQTGPQWKKQRAALTPLFTDQYLKHYCDIMKGITEGEITSWEGVRTDVARDMCALTEEILCRAVMGEIAHFDADKVAKYQLYINLVGFLPKFLWKFVYIPGVSKDAVALHRQMDGIARALIAKARTGALDPKCMLSVAAQAKNPDGTLWTDDEISHVTQQFLLAGHESTALTMTFTMALLAVNPQVQETARRQLLEVCGVSSLKDVAGALRFEHLSRLTYIWATFRETLRMYTSTPVHVRTCSKETFIDAHRIAKGTLVLMPITPLNYDEAVYPEPHTFNPDRWLTSPSGDRSDADPFAAGMPFGSGARRCIGQRFAEEEAVVVLALLLSRYEVEPVVDDVKALQAQPDAVKNKIECEVAVTLRPTKPTQVRFVHLVE
eukprot:PhM_4_TR9453/c0_g1_i1/m.5095